MTSSKTLPAVLSTVAAVLMSGSVETEARPARAFWGETVKGSGEVAVELRNVGEFSRIETLGAFDVFITPGDTQEVVLTFDDNLLELVKTEVVGKTLKIYADEPYRSRRTCKVDITVPRLEGVTTKGSGDIEVEGFDSERLECSTKGSGDITITDLICDDLFCHVNGSGDIIVNRVEGNFLKCRIAGSGDFKAVGEVESVEIGIYGSGDVDLRKLIAQEAEVVIKGSGDVKVYCEENFDGAIYGSGDIAVYGDPARVSKHIAGSGDLRFR
jgi:hypothetical protein